MSYWHPVFYASKKPEHGGQGNQSACLVDLLVPGPELVNIRDSSIWSTASTFCSNKEHPEVERQRIEPMLALAVSRS